MVYFALTSTMYLLGETIRIFFLRVHPYAPLCAEMQKATRHLRQPWQRANVSPLLSRYPVDGNNGLTFLLNSKRGPTPPILPNDKFPKDIDILQMEIIVFILVIYRSLCFKRDKL